MPSENGLTETQNIVLGCFIIATVMAAYIGGALWLGAKIGRGWAAALLLLLGVGIVGFFFRTLLKTSALRTYFRALIDADSWEAAQLMVERIRSFSATTPMRYLINSAGKQRMSTLLASTRNPRAAAAAARWV